MTSTTGTSTTGSSATTRSTTAAGTTSAAATSGDATSADRTSGDTTSGSTTGITTATGTTATGTTAAGATGTGDTAPAGGGAAPAGRVAITPAAAEVVERLRARHGPVVFHQSGGCCDGSSPMLYPDGDLIMGPRDVVLGRVAGAEFVMTTAQYRLWEHTHLTVDVVPGRGAGFSLEAPDGVRFLLRSRLLTEEESASAPPVAAG